MESQIITAEIVLKLLLLIIAEFFRIIFYETHALMFTVFCKTIE